MKTVYDIYRRIAPKIVSPCLPLHSKAMRNHCHILFSNVNSIHVRLLGADCSEGNDFWVSGVPIFFRLGAMACRGRPSRHEIGGGQDVVIYRYTVVRCLINMGNPPPSHCH